MRFIKYIFILSCLLPAVIFSLDSTDLCPSSFSNHREFVRAFFSDPKNINLYEGQKGYIEFVEEYLNFLQMDTVFNYASSSLSKDDMENLNWQTYKGTTKEFQEERSRILNEEGKIKKEYQVMEGYVRYADEFYGEGRKKLGDMKKVYKNVSAVLSESEKKNLNWQQYQGTTKEFREERLRILDEKGYVKKEYRNTEGYIRYADEFYGRGRKKLGDMHKTYRNVSAVLSESEKKNLNWQQYQGTIEDFQEERSRILDEKGNVKKEYQGVEGYVRYADEFYGGERKEFGDMLKAYINVSAVLNKSEKKNLNWQQYQGTTKEFREERSRILDEEGKVKEEYRGVKGYVHYADEFYGGKRKEFGDMFKAYKNVSAVLNGLEKKSLSWQIYKGTTENFQEERSRVLDKKGNVKKEYQGVEGYIHYADEFYGGERKEFGDMLKAYINVSAVLSESEKKSLNWQQYQGTTKEFRSERLRILSEEGKIKEKYQGPEGYVRYAIEFYGGRRKEFGDMQKTYMKVSAVLSESEKKSLNWQQYQGTTGKFQEERSKILDEKGKIKEEYQGVEGYVRYADEFYGGERKELGGMQKTYMNVSAVLSKEEMKNLVWKVFYGDTGQIRALFEFFKNHDFEDYKGSEGQKKVARMIFKDHLINTYKNISTLRDYLFNDKGEFKDLRESGWSRSLSW